MTLQTIRSHHQSALTGLSDNQFDQLVTRARAMAPDGGPGRPWRLGFADRILVTVVALRTNLEIRELAAIFDISKSQAHRIVARYTRVLATLFTVTRIDRRWAVAVDGTLVPTRDHTRAAKAKNYRYSTNVQVVCHRPTGRILAVGDAWPGSRNDGPVARAELGELLADHGRVLADSAYRRVDGCITPVMENRRIVRDDRWRRHRRRRARVEHAIARLKDHRVLRDCRRRGDAIDQITRAVAVLHNLKLEPTA